MPSLRLRNLSTSEIPFPSFRGGYRNFDARPKRPMIRAHRSVLTFPPNMEALKDRVAVVTGASEGIGAAIVRRLAAEGMRVAALARRIEKLTDLENELRDKGYTVNGYLCDVQRESSVKDAFYRIEEDFGGVHVLVNNAATAALVDMLNINMENTAAIINTNVLGAMSCIKETLALMKDHSILDGHIVNINSISGHRAPLREHGGVYGASKHALRVLTESLRADICKHKLKTRVTSISPGMVRTSMTDYFRKIHPDWPSLIAENIADALVYAITVPSNVNIKDGVVSGTIKQIQLNRATVEEQMESLKDRVAVVTGASEGIGEAIVRRLAAEGMKVAALARRIDKLTELENDLKSQGFNVKGYICDVQNESDVKATFQSIEKDFGQITLLVNNAGVSKLMSLEEMNFNDVNNIFNTNVVGVLACTKEGVASMKKHSVDRGHIVVINSVAGHRDIQAETIAVYCASKKAITSLCSSLRNSLKSSKIRVTSISPALVKTSMTRFMLDKTPDIPHLNTSDVADAVIYAVSAPTHVNVSEVILDNV